VAKPPHVKKEESNSREPVVNSKQEIAAAKAESMSEQQIAYQQKQHKNKADAQDASAIND
jgi:hypothetical protein